MNPDNRLDRYFEDRKDYRMAMKANPVLDRKKELILTRRLKSKNIRIKTAARETLILSNIGLVFLILNDLRRKFPRLSVPYLDLVQEGMIGLMKGIEHFDYRRKVRLSSYVGWWIYQSIMMAIYNKARLQRIPVATLRQVKRYRETYERLRHDHSFLPDDSKIARVLGISKKEAVILRETSRSDIKNLYSDTNDDEDLSRDRLGDKFIKQPWETTSLKEMPEQLWRALKKLKPREAYVIKLRFGLGNGECRTLDEIGNTLGVSREAIRQTQNTALAKLRTIIDAPA